MAGSCVSGCARGLPVWRGGEVRVARPQGRGAAWRGQVGRRTACRGSGGSSAEGVRFKKYQGLGNDFVVVDNRGSPTPSLTPAQAVRICDRNFGVGGDGLIFVMPPSDPTRFDYRMTIYNSDGSEPEMCGNGIRCLARYVADMEAPFVTSAVHRVETLAGLIVPEMQADGRVAVDMGEPIFAPAEVPTTLAATNGDGKVVNGVLPLSAAQVAAIPGSMGKATGGGGIEVTMVSMGNPHAICFVEDVNGVDLRTVGPAVEKHPAFPAKTNAEFVQVLSRDHLRMRVWERGAGITLACGTGTCATVVAGVLSGLCDRKATVDLPGGPLLIEWRESDNRIIMTGAAEPVFQGVLSPSVFDS